MLTFKHNHLLLRKYKVIFIRFGIIHLLGKGNNIVNSMVTASQWPEGGGGVSKPLKNDAILIKLLYSGSSIRQTVYKHDKQGCLYQNCESGVLLLRQGFMAHKVKIWTLKISFIPVQILIKLCA